MIASDCSQRNQEPGTLRYTVTSLAGDGTMERHHWPSPDIFSGKFSQDCSRQASNCQGFTRAA